MTKLAISGAEQTSADWTALKDACKNLQRGLRRKLDLSQLRSMELSIRALTDQVHALIAPQEASKTSEMSGTVTQIERHQQSSNKDDLESEQSHEKRTKAPQTIPLSLILKATPDICDYAPEGVRTWQDLVRVADLVRPMLGITLEAWQRACKVMGKEGAAVTLACMLQRHDTIIRPSGYLRTLTDKAEGQGFSPGPMVMALLRFGNGMQV